MFVLKVIHVFCLHVIEWLEMCMENNMLMHAN